MDVAGAYGLFVKALEAGKLAHGYLVTGNLKGECAEFTDLVLRRLFPDATEQVAAKTHPDIAWLEPEGKSRTIHIQSMREKIVAPMAASSFSGGWKAGIITGADRMELAAANAFLKTLEEPTPKTVFLMLTDNPDSMLPTIISRSQRIDLPLGEGILEGESFEAVAEAMARARSGVGTYGRGRIARELAGIFAELKEEAASEDVATVRKAFFKTIMKFAREWMLSGALKDFQAFHNIKAVEEAYRQSDRSINDEAVLGFMIDRMILPE